jgi:PEP-CTERM motif
MTQSRFLLSLVVVLIPAAAMGTPLNITETTDFQNSSPGPIIGTFDVGLNTVSGSVNGAFLGLVGDFQDSFTLILPAGLAVTSAEVVVTNFTYGDGAAISSNGEVFFPPFVGITGDGTYVFSGDSSNFSVGSLNISVLSPESTNANNPGPTPPSPSELVAGGFNYTLEYQVAAVPEPSATVLIGIGLCAIFIKRRFCRI